MPLRSFPKLAIILLLTSAAPAQQTLTIRLNAPALSESDRQHLLQTLQADPSGTQEELLEKARYIARDMGYFKATTQAPHPESTPDGITVNLDAGPEYHLGPFTFSGNHALTSEQLEPSLALHPGDVVRYSQIGKTLENLRQTCARAGYINEITSPGVRIDERGRIICFDLYIDEGRPFTLGALSVVGNESHPGNTGRLLESWKDLQGQLFNPDTLDRWLQENKAQCPDCNRSRDLIFAQDSKVNRVNVKIVMPKLTGPVDANR